VEGDGNRNGRGKGGAKGTGLPPLYETSECDCVWDIAYYYNVILINILSFK